MVSTMIGSGRSLLWAVALAALAGSVSPVPAEEGARSLVLTPGTTVRVQPRLADLEGGKKVKKVEGSKALKGARLRGIVTEPVFAQGCRVIAAQAEVGLEVVDASAPQAAGQPGYIHFKLIEVTFTDGNPRAWEGGSHCLSGVDKSDQGKRLMVLPRKGGPASIRSGETIELELVPKSAAPPPGCGQEAEGKGGAPAAGAEEPAPRVIVLPAVACR